MEPWRRAKQRRSQECPGCSPRVSTSTAGKQPRPVRRLRTRRSAGSTGCNRFTGPYSLDGGSLEIGTLASTRMACAPPADAVERAYLSALARVAGWRFDGAELVLLDGDGAELLRYTTATPVGEWNATAIQTGVALSSPLPGTEITATFADDGTLTGSAGCNSYTTDLHDRARRDRDRSAGCDREGLRRARRRDGARGGLSRRASVRGPLQSRRRIARASERRRNVRRVVLAADEALTSSG